jgi:hypothetical protein
MSRVALFLLLAGCAVDDTRGASLDPVASPFGMHPAFRRPYLRTNEAPDLGRVYGAADGYAEALDIGVRWERPGLHAAYRPAPYRWEATDQERYTDALYSAVPPSLSILANVRLYAEPFLAGAGSWRFKDATARKDYVAFVRALVERYDGDGVDDMPGLKSPIRHWQVGNEPVISNQDQALPAPSLNLDWAGFAELMESTCEAIRASDPGAVVLVGGTLGGESLYRDPDVYFKQRDAFYAPLLQKLAGKCIDIFDIHYYDEPKMGMLGSRSVYDDYRALLDHYGYRDTPIWFTETGAASRAPASELQQAGDVIKAFVYPLSYGVKKVFWAFAMVEGYPPLTGEDYFDHTGLIYDGIGAGDPGYGVKKLGYHAFKKMTETLEGCDWSRVRVLQERAGVNVYELWKDGRPLWVAWNSNAEEREAAIAGIASGTVQVTEAVPRFERGQEVADYRTAFASETKRVENGEVRVRLGRRPVYVVPSESR